MKKLIFLTLLSVSSLLAQPTNFPSYTNNVWSVTNLCTKFGFDADDLTYTNGFLIKKGAIQLNGTNNYINLVYPSDIATSSNSVTMYGGSNAFHLLLNTTNGVISDMLCLSNVLGDKLWIYSGRGFSSNNPTLGTLYSPYEINLTNSVTINGVTGMTTNVNLAGVTNATSGGYKTNRLQFSNGLLTNVVNNF